jgi:nitronate monooxygenase
MASDEYKQMVVQEKIGPAPSFLPTVYSSKISGVGANFIRASLEKCGIDPEDPKGEGLGNEDFSKLDAGSGGAEKKHAGSGTVLF